MLCPDCEKELFVSKKVDSIILLCSFCGLNKRYYTLDKDEAYERLLEQRNKKSSKPENRIRNAALPIIKRKTKEEKINLIKNAGIEPDSLPNAVKRIIDNPDEELVFYSFLKQQFPPISSKEKIYPKELNNLLQESGIKSLFEFQVEAFEMIQKGKDIVIVAPTGTGKTESFILPVISKIWESNPHPLLRRGVSAIIIYPTKALAKDQHKKISKYGSVLGVNSEIFDGDTPKDVRNRIFQYPPDIIITNPDMLHYHMRRTQFRELLHRVKFVIIDEIHIAVGAFGSNLYFILKRLQRLSKYKIKFIGASATIGNGQEFASQLFGRDVKAITVKTARKAAIHLLMVMPYAVSQYTITASIAQQLLYSKYKTLCFQNNHKNAEIINLMLKRAKLKSAVHRAGLTKEYRDRVENNFRKGQLDILVSTPTLELGIDIGDVSAVISSIVDVTSFTQRLGRAGRKGQESIGVLILRNDDPISTYYSTHPFTYFEDVRKGYIEPKNEIVSYYQTLAAILDKPIEKGEFLEIESIIKQLVKQQLIRLTSKNLYRPIRRKDIEQLLKNYSIRGIGDTLTIKDVKQRILGERSMPMAARELHAGAIYLHGGKYYRSRSFNYKPELGLGDIIIEEMNPQNQKTTSMRFALPKMMQIIEKKNVLGTEVVYCDLQITEYVTGYKITDIYSNELLGITEIDPPIVYTFPTKGFMFTAPHPSQIISRFPEISEEAIFNGTFHAVEHVLIESSSMLTGGGNAELGGISMGDSGAIFVYDGAKGGSGLSKLLYDRLEEGFKRSLIILENCTCKTTDGCPRCTYSYQCGNNNQPLNKIGAMESLKLLKESDLKIIENYEEYQAYV